MLEKGIRGGITQVVKRYTKANNKYMSDLYNPDEESIYIISTWMQTTFTVGDGSKTKNTWIFMEGGRGLYP